MPELTVVVPAYLEAEHIAETADAIRAALDRLALDWELLVVDNASPDGTADALAPLAAADPRIRVLRNDSNRGKGYSVRRGMLEATGDLRLHLDADCAPSLQSLPRLLGLIESGADVAVGSRLAGGARVLQRQPLRRRIAGRGFVELCRRVLDLPTRDIYCGFKLWRGDVAAAAYERVRLEDWVFDAEVLALARALGYEVREAGVVWRDRAGSRLSMPRVIVPATRDLLRARSHARAVARETGLAAAPCADTA